MRLTILRTVALAGLLLGLCSTARAHGVPGLIEPELTEREHAHLKTRLDERWRIVPTRDGLLLVPRQPSGLVKGVELAGPLVYIDGKPATGADLYRRLGADAEAVLQLSALSKTDRDALFPPQATAPQDPQVERPRHDPARDADSAVVSPVPPVTSSPEIRSTHGARVRIGGDVAVAEQEQVDDVVAVFGSADVRGLVTGNLVTIGGDIKLGPKAVVRGNVVTVGGRVSADPGAIVSGDTTELSPVGTNLRWWAIDHGDPQTLNVAVHPDWPRITRTIFYIGLAGCLFWFVMSAGLTTIAPRAVARARSEMASSPIAAFLVGLMLQLLALPALAAIALALAMSVIGIPLLAVVPLLACAFAIAAVIGFAGSSQAIGERLVGPRAPAIASLTVGLLMVWGLGMIGRYLWMIGFDRYGLATMAVVLGVAIEGVVWTMGVGGAALALLGGRRAGAAAAPQPTRPVPPPMPESPSLSQL